MCTMLLYFHFCVYSRVLTTKNLVSIHHPTTDPLYPFHPPCYPSRPSESKHGDIEWLLPEGKGYFHLLMHFFLPLSFYLHSPIAPVLLPFLSLMHITHTEHTHTRARAQWQSTTSGSRAPQSVRSDSHPASSAVTQLTWLNLSEWPFPCLISDDDARTFFLGRWWGANL